MLEEILKTINTNLERIAKALEGTNKPIANTVNIMEQKTQEIQEPVVTPQVNQVSVATPVPQPQQIPTVIPTTQMQETFTQEKLAVAMSNAVSAGKMNIIQNILSQFNVQALTQIAPADYNKVATMLKEQGVEV